MQDQRYSALHMKKKAARDYNQNKINKNLIKSYMMQ